MDEVVFPASVIMAVPPPDPAKTLPLNQPIPLLSALHPDTRPLFMTPVVAFSPLLDARQAVACDLLTRLTLQFDRVALLRRRHDQLRGWMGSGPGLNQGRLLRYTVSFRQPSVFLNLDLGVPFHYGPLAPMPAHEQLLRCWNGEPAGECLVLPVRLPVGSDQRLVTAIYADRQGPPLSGTELARLRRLALETARAFATCILDCRKSPRRCVTFGGV